MSKVLAFKTLYFENNQLFITRGKLYPLHVYNNAKALHNLNLNFRTVDDKLVCFSDDIKSDMHVDNVFQDYERYKMEDSNERKGKQT